MTSDQEPRYRLVDSNGVIRGTLYGKPDGSVAIQETDSGADREVALAPDGTFSAPSVETESVSTESLVSESKPWVDVTHPEYGAAGDGSDATAAFDAARDGSGKIIFVPPGEYELSDTTLLFPNTTVLLSNGAVLKDGADVPLFRMNEGCEIIGGRIELSNTYTSEAILFDGSFGIGSQENRTGIRNVDIKGTGQNGTGVRYFAEGDNEFISLTQLEGSKFRDLQHAIEIEVNTATGGRSFVNGNQFVNNEFTGNELSILMQAGGDGQSDIHGNRFVNIQDQPTSGASPVNMVRTELTATDGGNVGNSYISYKAWDTDILSGETFDLAGSTIETTVVDGPPKSDINDPNRTVFTAGVERTPTVAEASPATDQILPSGEWTTLTLDSFSGPSDFELSDDTVTVPRGRYEITVQTYYEADAGWTTGDRVGINPVINGSFADGINRFYGKTNEETESFSSTQAVEFSSESTVGVSVRQNTGSDKTLLESGTTLIVSRIG